jgi:hypothetical protein
LGQKSLRIENRGLPFSIFHSRSSVGDFAAWLLGG